MKNNLISVIIVSWNGKRWIKKCLDSIHKQSYRNIEVIFVDNNSTDDSVEYVKSKYPDVKTIINNENYGFGVANNIGIERSKGDILFLLNNDTAMPRDTIQKLLECKTDLGLNIVGPRLLNTEGVDPLGGRFMQSDPLGSPGVDPVRLFYIEGCALMIDKMDITKLKRFDEKYFMYAEDIDLCWRAHLYGMKLGICEDAKVIHYGGGSSLKTQLRKGFRHTSSFSRRLWVESYTLRNILKNYSRLTLVLVIPIYLALALLESSIYLLTGNTRLFSVAFRAIAWNLVNIGDTIKKRQIVQSNRVTSDAYVLSKMYVGSNKIKAFLQYGIPQFK